jgi:hypothetical protein
MSNDFTYAQRAVDFTLTRIVQPTYGNNALVMNVNFDTMVTVLANPYTETLQPVRLYRKIGVSLSGTTKPALTLQCSLDNVTWYTIPADCCQSDHSPKNVIPDTGGVLFAEAHCPVFWRVSMGAVASPDYSVVISLNGRGEVGRDSTSRSTW